MERHWDRQDDIVGEISRYIDVGDLVITRHNNMFLVMLDLSDVVVFGRGKDLRQAFAELKVNANAINQL